MKSWLSKKELNKPIVILLIVLLSLSSFMAGATKILTLSLEYSVGIGSSMEPTLKDGTKMIVSLKKDKTLDRGDLVGVLVYEGDKPLIIIKRIIGLPNESISIKNDITYIDGKQLNEPYAYYSSISTDNLFMTLGEEEYFVNGDTFEFTESTMDLEDLITRFMLNKVSNEKK